ncbi:hypothetical protein HPP92_014649 [Vanilla planifolia]|uniref:Lysine ketoglutarate reductase trans-splicing-like protein n=1 Tax=Vanilla planifolia TaxID=51239 RepID=A0A835QQX1_VANPL|nr:hypothetical protein HPP92_015124 [Vanilla planifolia]KAG0474963.1 hypothetical protein HPP92_014649 [Vanilla planifolia]
MATVVTMRIQYEQLKVTERFGTQSTGQTNFRASISALPHGIIQSTIDMGMKPPSGFKLKDNDVTWTGLLAVAVGISQKQNVDSIVNKFLADKCSIILFHYDGKVDEWHDLDWSDKAVHVIAQNQTKWWFAKRFLHPDVIDMYDYIFLWDEDIAVDYFQPRRYMQIAFSEGLEISQPAVDPELSLDIHHRITVRSKKAKVHRRVYFSGSMNCTEESRGPPCTGWVEGMVPVFSKAAWRCVWHLIQNDLIHGWGLDMKLGYCSQGDRTKNVGVIDEEFIVHKGIPSLGGVHDKKVPSHKSLDSRSRIRRQSTAELEKFKQRWDIAIQEDKDWTDPFDIQKR